MKINNVNFTGAPRGMKKASTAVALAAASMLPMACADGAGKLVSSEPVRDTVATVVKDTVRKNIDSTKDFFANLYVHAPSGLKIFNFSSQKQDLTIGTITAVNNVAARATGAIASQAEKVYLNQTSKSLVGDITHEVAAGNIQMSDTTSNSARIFFEQYLGKNLYPDALAEKSINQECIRFSKVTDAKWMEMNKNITNKDSLIPVVFARDEITPDLANSLGKDPNAERIIMIKCVE